MLRQKWRHVMIQYFRPWVLWMMVCVLGLTLSTQLLQSQTLASVSVSVQDTTGAMIQYAKLRLSSNATGVQRQDETNENGLAQIISLPPGAWYSTSTTPRTTSSKKRRNGFPRWAPLTISASTASDCCS